MRANVLLLVCLAAGCCALRMLQIADLHLDLNYTVGSNATCERSVCCHTESVWVPHAGPQQAAGKWGSYACDAPFRQLDEALRFGASLQPDIVLFTGDDTSHFYWAQSRESNLQAIDATTQLIKKHFPGTPVFPCLGNHETYPLSQFEIPVHPTMDWLMSKLKLWYASWLSEDARETFGRWGYFTERVRKGLRIVSLNTLLYDEYNFAAHKPLVSDPAGQRAWLEKVLLSARASHEKVYVIGHISPGQKPSVPLPNTVTEFSAYWESLLARFSDLIAAVFTAHIHRDTFRVNVTSPGGPVTFLAPSMTAYSQTNPGMRLYVSSDDSSARILDYTQYWSNLTVDNERDAPQWHESYTWSSEYGGRSWVEVAKDLGREDTDTWETYWRNYAVRHISDKYACTGLCRSLQYCSMVELQFPKYERCLLER